MSNKKLFMEFSNSQRELKCFMDAIDDYDSFADVVIREGGSIIHEAHCKVFERIETNYSHVDIIWDDKDKDSRFYQQYRNDYQVFKAYDNILVIDATDRNGNPIEIEIRKSKK